MEENYSLHKVCGDSLLPEHPPKAQFLMNFSIPWNIEMHLHVHSILIIEIALLVAQQCRAHNQLWRAWKRCAKWVPWRGDGAASGGETVRWEEGKCTFQCFQFLLIHCFASRSLVSRSENWFFLPLVFFFSLSSAFVLPLNDDDDGVDLRKYAWNDMHDAGWWWNGLIETTRNGNWKNKKIIVWVLLVVKEKNISLGKFTPARAPSLAHSSPIWINSTARSYHANKRREEGKEWKLCTSRGYLLNYRYLSSTALSAEMGFFSFFALWELHKIFTRIVNLILWYFLINNSSKFILLDNSLSSLLWSSDGIINMESIKKIRCFFFLFGPLQVRRVNKLQNFPHRIRLSRSRFHCSKRAGEEENWKKTRLLIMQSRRWNRRVRERCRCKIVIQCNENISKSFLRAIKSMGKKWRKKYSIIEIIRAHPWDHKIYVCIDSYYNIFVVSTRRWLMLRVSVGGRLWMMLSYALI